MLSILFTASLGVGLLSAPNNYDIEMNLRHPGDVNQDGMVKVCVNSNATDCDYSANQSGSKFSAKLDFPIMAEISLPHEILKVYQVGEANSTGEFTQLSVTSPSYGPIPQQGRSFSDYIQHIILPESQRSILAFNIPREETNFGSLLAYPENAEMDWEITLVVHGNPYFMTRRPPVDFVLVFGSNYDDCFTCFGYPQLPKLNVYYE